MKNEKNEHDPSVNPRDHKYFFLLLLATILTGLACLYPTLAESSYTGSADLHATIEIVGAVLGLIAGLAFVGRFYVLGDRFLLFVGLAFFVNGAEDFVHGLLAFERIYNLTGLPRSSIEQFIPGTYVTGRILMGVLLLTAPLAVILFRESANPKRETLRTSFAVVIVTMCATAVAFKLPLPRFIYPQLFISRPIDFVSAIILAVAFLAFLLRYYFRPTMLMWWILFSVGVNVVGQVMMSFSKSLYDPFFDVAHVCKVLGYAIPLLGFSLYQITEITQRVHTEGTLRQEQENLTAIFNAAPVGMLLIDENTNIKQVNNIAMGFTSEDGARFIGTQHGDALCCVHARASEKGCGHSPVCSICSIRKIIEGVLASGEAIQQVEIQPTLLLNGKELSPWLEISGEPVYIDDEKYVILAVNNISGRKRAEKELKKRRTPPRKRTGPRVSFSPT